MKITLDSFLTVLKQSGLVTPDDLAKLLSDYRAAEVGDSTQESPATISAKGFATYLVRSKTLTTWQAEKLLMGKHKGFTLGKYKLLGLLGKGGMSSVYLAEHTLMRRRVALKVLPHKRVGDASYLGRFHREAQAVASLDHPNIVRAYDVDHEQDKTMQIHFLVMEHVEGRNLQEIVAQDGPQPPARAAEFVRQAAAGLQHAHENGLVHRDIKPGNLLVDGSGTVKMLDLGLARFFNENEESLTIEHDEKVLGTADYLAPEQAVDSHLVDHRADIYSLGCTMYFLLTGHPPFTEGSLAQRLIAHQTKEPPPVSDDRDDMPESLDAILRQMMSKSPDDRPQTAGDVERLLGGWLAGQNGTAAAATAAVVPAAVPEEAVEEELSNFFDNLDEMSGPGSGSMVGPAARRGRSSGRLKTGRGSGRLAGKSGVPIVADDEPGEDAAVVGESSLRRGSSVVRGESPTRRTLTIAGIAALAVLAGLGVLQMTGGDDPAPAPPPSGPGTPAAPSVAADAARPPVSGTVATVGAASAANFATVQRALDWATDRGEDGLTIQLAAGETFAAKIDLDGLGFGNPVTERLTIETPAGQKPATLTLPDGGDGPVLFARSTTGFKLRNIVVDGGGQPVAVQVAGFVDSSAIEDCRITGFTEAGLVAKGVTIGYDDRRFVVRRTTIETDRGGTDLVRVVKDGIESSNLRVEQCRLLGPADGKASAGLAIRGDADRIELLRTIVTRCDAGVRMHWGQADLDRVRILNNTFYECDRGILLEQMPVGTSEKMQVARNLFVDLTGEELEIREGFDPKRAAALIDVRGENYSTRQSPSRQMAIDLFGGQDRRIESAGFVSTDRQSDQFLKPSFGRLKTAAGGPKFVGAVQP